jgi:hypothetical protein
VTTGLEVGLEQGLALERELQQRLFEGDDAKEGIAAYNARRAPVFFVHSGSELARVLLKAGSYPRLAHPAARPLLIRVSPGTPALSGRSYVSYESRCKKE